MKKSVQAVILAVIIICIILGTTIYFVNKPVVVSDMDTDTTNTIITGIHDAENLNLSEYNYLAIPDSDFKVLTTGGNTSFYKEVIGIGEGAFKGNTYIKKVYIPRNITQIGKNAFDGCTSVKKIYFGGSEEEWKKIKIENGNDILSTAKIEYDSEMPSVDD